MFRRKKYLYHVTHKDNVPYVLKDGLKRSACGRRTFAIYLSENPLSWYIGNDYEAILKVDIRGLKIKTTTFKPEIDEVLVWGDIPPTIETKKGKVSRFEDVTDIYVGHSKWKGGEAE